MYKSDFFLDLGQDRRRDSRPSSPWPTPCATCGRATSPPRSSSPASASPCSATTPPVPASPSPPPATCWAWKCRIWTRGKIPDRPRRDRPRDRQHDLLHGRRHRHPRRHVHRQGQRLSCTTFLNAVTGRLPGRRAGAAAHAGQPPVRHRPPHPVHGRHAAHHPPLRRRGEPEGQEDRHDLGLFSLLRQAPLRASGRHRPVHPLRHGRRAGSSRGL